MTLGNGPGGAEGREENGRIMSQSAKEITPGCNGLCGLGKERKAWRRLPDSS